MRCWIESFFQKLIQLIFPPKCIFCNEVLTLGTKQEICNCCYEKIPFAGELFMNSCSNDRNQTGCDGVVCVCHYSGIIKQSLIRYKFYNKPGYHRALAKLLYDKTSKSIDYREFDIITSVPLHRQRENIRGYNQSHLISKALGRETGISVESRLLYRIRKTESQSLLVRCKREFNVKNAFEITDINKVRGKNILIVDDIMTTGYTLDECSRVLKEAGAKKVIGAVVASGRKY